jgi:hypothetical protein
VVTSCIQKFHLKCLNNHKEKVRLDTNVHSAKTHHVFMTQMMIIDPQLILPFYNAPIVVRIVVLIVKMIIIGIKIKICGVLI